jgi:dihydroxyacid dehydratase/phosphogluconate dehydratase
MSKFTVVVLIRRLVVSVNITDGLFPGGTWGMVVGHCAPKAFEGGTIALAQDGDSVTIDAKQLLLQLNVPEAEIAKRRTAFVEPAPRYKRGVQAKFAFNLDSAVGHTQLRPGESLWVGVRTTRTHVR